MNENHVKRKKTTEQIFPCHLNKAFSLKATILCFYMSKIRLTEYTAYH